MISLLLLAPVFLAPSQDGPGIQTADGMTWHRVDAGSSRAFTVPGAGRVVALVRRLQPQEGADAVSATLSQDDKTIWTASLSKERGAQLGDAIAGRALRGAPEAALRAGELRVTCSPGDHGGLIVQIEWQGEAAAPDALPALAVIKPEATPDLVGLAPLPALVAAAPEGSAEAEAAAPTAAEPEGEAANPADTKPEDQPAATTDAKPEDQAGAADDAKPEDEPAATTDAKPEDQAGAAADAKPEDEPAATTDAKPEDEAGANADAKPEDEAGAPADAKPEDKVDAPPAAAKVAVLPISAVDGGLSLRAVSGGMVGGNVALRFGADLRREFIPKAKLGLELGFTYRSTSGNALLPHPGMTASASGSTVQNIGLSSWSVPVMARYRRPLPQQGLLTSVMIGPVFGLASIAQGDMSSSEFLAGFAARARVQRAQSLRVGGADFRLGLELGLESVFSTSIASSRAYVGVDAGLPWSL